MLLGAIMHLACLCGAAAVAADPPAEAPVPGADYRRWADVTEWRGQIGYARYYAWEETAGGGHRRGEHDEQGVAYLHLDRVRTGEDLVEWTGTGRVSASMWMRDVFTGGGTSITTTRSAGGEFVMDRAWLGMDFDDKHLRAGADKTESQRADFHTVFRGGGVTQTTTRKGHWSPRANRLVEKEPLPLPVVGRGLSGSSAPVDDRVTAPMYKDHGMSIVVPVTAARVELSWTFAPVWRDVELVVEADGYDAWLPGATPDGVHPGNYLTVRATLQARDGGPPPHKAERITFELRDTSREPGVCMNWPPTEGAAPSVAPGGAPAARELPDLRFDPTRGTATVPAGAEFQAVATPDGAHATATAAIACYDWGAWADLRVTAELPGGRVVYGHLKGQPEQLLIPLPRRRPASKIADPWKETMPGANVPDASDDDHVRGNPNDGDGFSAYEEYRGFHVNGRHVRLDPRRKELFVLDRVKGQTVRGFRMFQRGTGIVPLHQLRPAEMRADRAMNVNRSDRAPRAWDEPQHGLIVELGTDPDNSYADSDRGPTVPKHVRAIRLSPSIPPFRGLISRFTRDGVEYASDESASTIAHEMAHACSVPHHGEDDPGMRKWWPDTSVKPPVTREYRIGSDNKVLPDPKDPTRPSAGTVVRVFVEGTTGAVGLAADHEVLVGGLDLYVAANRGGQHAGDEACFMRYDAAQAYVHPRNPAWRVLLTDEEVSGETLCDEKAGTGVNDPTRKPWPRYGNATAGACAAQVNIVDGSVP